MPGKTLTVGQLVESIAGRDIGRWYLVVGAKDKWMLLADGRRRKLSEPKTKQRRHVKTLGYSDEEWLDKINADTLSDEDVRQILNDFKKRSRGDSRVQAGCYRG